MTFLFGIERNIHEPSPSGFDTTSITWGLSNNIGEPNIPNALTFTPATFSGITANPESAAFEIGTVTFFNSSVLRNTDIGGATLTITLNTNQGAIQDIVNLQFVATSNTGISPQRDSDWVQGFVPLTGTVSLNAFEDATVTATLSGKIFGDPMLTITNIELAPGQTGNGFIGNGIKDIPKIADTGATFCLLLIGLGATRLAQRTMSRPKFDVSV